MTLCAPLPGLSVPPGLPHSISANNAKSVLLEWYLATRPNEDGAWSLRPRVGHVSPVTCQLTHLRSVAAAEMS